MKRRTLATLLCGAAAGIFMIAAPLISEVTKEGRAPALPVAAREEAVYLTAGPARSPGLDAAAAFAERFGAGSYAASGASERSDAGGAVSAAESAEAPSETEAPAADPPETGSDAPETGIRLLNAKTGAITVLPLEEYLVGVVAAEMPYTFQAEALKAQAVAARSYCLYKTEHGLTHEGGADVCTSYAHCAAYVTGDELIARYGKSTAARILKKVRAAVSDTAGEIVTYEGKPALALFHSGSFGTTESSVNVWGGDYPYLVSVPTPEEDRVTTVTVSDAALYKAFTGSDAIPASTGTLTLTSVIGDTGRQKTLTCAGVTLTGRTLRSRLSLASCRFEYEKIGDEWVFTVHGYGHGVGMSQYGANAMAAAGADYRAILLHYYQGVEIEIRGG